MTFDRISCVRAPTGAEPRQGTLAMASNLASAESSARRVLMALPAAVVASASALLALQPTHLPGHFD